MAAFGRKPVLAVLERSGPRDVPARAGMPQPCPGNISPLLIYKSAAAGVNTCEHLKTTGTSQDWQRRLYEAKAAQWLLYGRALGLSHCEAQDVLQETFIALLALPAAPDSPEFYSLRAFRNRALNYRRGLWRRLRRELESIQWFERPDAPDAREAQAMGRLQQLPAEQREVIVLKIWHRHTFDQIGRLLDISPNTAAGR